MNTLNLRNYRENRELIAESTFNEIEEFPDRIIADATMITKIDPQLKGGDDFCNSYGVSRSNGANCVILEATKGDKKWYVATLTPVGAKMDIGSSLRRYLNARRVSMAPLNYVLEQTGMEYGSITVVGLPKDWLVLIDSRLTDIDELFIGSGKERSKMRLKGKFFKNNERYILYEGLGIIPES